MANDIFIGGGGAAYGAPQMLLLDKSNRHGLIAGATGTGKTVTLQIMAEGFAAAGVPVFLSDVKGDLSGLAVSGTPDHKLHGPFMKRAETIGLDLQYDEPALDLADLMRVDAQGRGEINILAADQLMGSPRLYATFLLWLLSELFEELPEVGNPDKPKLVFFFDEAHLLFDGAPKALVDKVEQVARLIRSKGVGVYFVTQNPADIPDDILGQLGNRVQHALRAFTAKDRKELKTAAETYRDNPDFDTAEAIQQVGTGEAVTSFLDAKGIPQVVQRTLIRPPSSQLGPIDMPTRKAIMAAPQKRQRPQKKPQSSKSVSINRRGVMMAVRQHRAARHAGHANPMGSADRWRGW